MRTCSKCGNDFPETPEFFHRHGPGLRPDCKQCRSKVAAARYQANSETILAKNQAWREANRDKVAAQSRRWNAAHPERRRATKRRYEERHRQLVTHRHRKWCERNRERLREYEQQHYARTRERHLTLARTNRAENRLRYRAYTAKRRARQLAGGTFTSDDILRQHAVQDGRCRWCSCELNGSYHVDHVIPLARGGSNTADNLVLACAPCNQRKSFLLPFDEWNPPNPLPL